jgi:hypothetical protein
MTSAMNPPEDGSGEPATEIERRLEERLASGLPPNLAQKAITESRRWRKAVREVPAGYLCFHSLEMETHLSEDDKLALLVRAGIDFINQEKRGGPAPRPLESFVQACLRFPDKGDKIEEPIGEMARFVDFEVAARYYFPTDRPEAMYLSFSSSETSALWKKNRLRESVLVRDPLFQRSLEGRIRGTNDVNVFSTLADWVERLGLQGLALAERMRDALGLPHLARKHVLELRIPESAFREGQMLKPTFADAGGYPPFLPSRPGDAYGFARDLSMDESKTRGFPEVYHPPLATREISGLRYLGGPTGDLADGIWKDYKAYNDAHSPS